MTALREFVSGEDAIGRLTYETVQEYKQRLDLFERNYETGGFGRGLRCGG
ncbi:MAG: hypothetical protein MZW92_75485 [Comamonadaceae bacterium]|nr:hypothetical protein [Comamonadaceae bacterium]